MSQSSASNPDHQNTDPDQPVISSEQAQPMTPTNVSGSAMLDAHAATGETQPEGEPTDYPIATNFSSASTTGDPKTADVSAARGPYSADRESPDKGRVNLHNNPNVPDADMQGKLPNTDPVGAPLDPDTNLPE